MLNYKKLYLLYREEQLTVCKRGGRKRGLGTCAPMAFLRDRTIAARGGKVPCMIVSDNGTEFTSRAILEWQHTAKIEWHYIAPGMPMQNPCN